jgi:glycosyltransferase involved in cell wall biosynthesis
MRYVWQRRWILVTRPVISTLRFRLRHRRLDPGVTILIANWQTGSFLEASIPQILRRSPAGTRIAVVDNASAEDDRALLRSLPSAVRVLRLPVNVGHGVALDLAAMLASTESILALDADAFPIDDGWIERLERPLRDGRTVSGAGGSLGQIAPCCLMISLDRFVRRRHTFTARFVPGNEPWLRPDNVWDVGRSISLREGAASLHRVERTGYLDEGRQIGEIFDDVIYHNGYATVDLAPGNRGTVTKSDALATWHRALERFGVNTER